MVKTLVRDYEALWVVFTPVPSLLFTLPQQYLTGERDPAGSSKSLRMVGGKNQEPTMVGRVNCGGDLWNAI